MLLSLHKKNVNILQVLFGIYLTETHLQPGTVWKVERELKTLNHFTKRSFLKT